MCIRDRDWAPYLLRSSPLPNRRSPPSQPKTLNTLALKRVSILAVIGGVTPGAATIQGPWAPSPINYKLQSTLQRKLRCNRTTRLTMLKFYKVMGTPPPTYEFETWTLRNQRIQVAEMKFLKQVKDSFLRDQISNEGIKAELVIYSTNHRIRQSSLE